jgi:uroporphyrinogen decarboxylase
MIQPEPNFERLMTALFCGQPDRVPLAEVLIDEEAKEAFLGKQLNDLETDIEFYTKAGYDYISLGRRIAGFPGVWEAARFANYYEAQRSVGKGSMQGQIKSWEDFKNYPWMKKEDLDFRILDKAEKILPPEMKVVRYLGPVFQMVWLLMGFEEFSYKLAEDPALVKAVWEKVFELVYAEYEDTIKRDVVGAIWYVDDIAIKDRLMVPPALLRDQLFPRLKLISEGCKSRGIPLIYHTDGDITKVLDDIIAAGVNAIHPIDPTGLDIYRFKPMVLNKLCVIGNIDVDLLTLGEPEEVVADTKEHLKRLAPDGGYVVSTSNSVVRSFKPENYRAMLETVYQYGGYPICIDD